MSESNTKKTKTLVKIEFTYSDGSKKWLEGKDAETWFGLINHAFIPIREENVKRGQAVGKLNWQTS